MKQEVLTQHVKRVAMRQDRIVLSLHACRKMHERGITVRQLVEVLRSGTIPFDGRRQTTRHGKEIRFRMEAKPGDRLLAVIAVIGLAKTSNIYVITVMEIY